MIKALENYLWNEIGTAGNPKRSPRDVINEMIDRGWINSYKQGLATLDKWSGKGKYNYGCCLDLGWKEE